MYAVVVKVRISNEEAAEGALRDQACLEVPGVVAGYWTREDNTGLSMVVFASEEAANGMSEQVRSMAPAGVTVEDVEVREVVVHA